MARTTAIAAATALGAAAAGAVAAAPLVAAAAAAPLAGGVGGVVVDWLFGTVQQHDAFMQVLGYVGGVFGLLTWPAESSTLLRVAKPTPDRHQPTNQPNKQPHDLLGS